MPEPVFNLNLRLRESPLFLLALILLRAVLGCEPPHHPLTNVTVALESGPMSLDPRFGLSAGTGLLPPSHWAYEPDVELYPYDPVKASHLLDEAGWRRPEGSSSTTRLKLTFKTLTEESSRQIPEIIQQFLKQIGIAVDLQSYELGTFYSDVVRGNFQMYRLR